jgi:mannobiose 2-epimerase
MIKRLPETFGFFTAVILLLAGQSCQPPTAEVSEEVHAARNAKKEVARELEENLLQTWYPLTIDSVYGGFLTNFSHEWQPEEQQSKLIVSQARHLWTLSKVAALYPGESLYRKAADHAYTFLTEKMWDKEHGGFFWLLSREGEPEMENVHNRLKRVYGNAFAIYGLAAYYELSQKEEALAKARQAFYWLDEHAHDPELGGFFSTLDREGSVIDSSMFTVEYPMQSYFYKDQNTSIHVLEALTELYQVWPDDTLQARLQEMFHLVRDRMVSDEGYLRLFFYDNWQPVSYADSARSVREANYNLDHVSFGHDIETAYLLLEASEALGDYEREQTLAKARKMVDHCLRWGFDRQNSGLYDRGYYVEGTDSVEIIHDHKVWWAQAEALNALFLFAGLFPENQSYRREFDRMWDYTQAYVIDQQHGGWFPHGLDTHPEAKVLRKASPWKANYHNARALMNLLRMMDQADSPS